MELATTLSNRFTLTEESKAAWRTAVIAFLASRLVLLLVGWIALSFIATRGTEPHGLGASLQAMKDLAYRWDTKWHMSIATYGYSTVSPPSQPYATNFAFWPL